VRVAINLHDELEGIGDEVANAEATDGNLPTELDA
jgi:hypothetical protein